MFLCHVCRGKGSCEFAFESSTLYMRHIRRAHKDITDSCFRIICQIDGCPKEFHSYAGYVKHRWRNHKSQSSAAEEPILSETDPLLFQSTNNCEPNDHNSLEEELVQQHVPEATKESDDLETLQTESELQVFHLQSRHNLTQVAVDDIVQMMKRHEEEMWTRIKTLVSDSSLLHNLSAKIYPFQHRFDRLGNAYSRRQVFEQNIDFCQPQEVIVGFTTKTQGCRDNRSLERHPRSIQYISLRNTIRLLINNISFCKMVKNYDGMKTSMTRDNRDQYLRDFCDGQVLQNHPLFTSSPTALQLLLYFDDLELCNPLGSKSRKHKISVFYVSFGNINPIYRSRLANIFLLAIAHTSDVVKFGIDKVLSTFYEELEILSDKGFEVQLKKGGVINVKGSLLAVISDTLAAHQITGFKEGVGFAKQKCRHCLCNFDDMQRMFFESNFKLRSLQTHVNIHCKNICRKSSTEFGVNRLSSLFKVPYFNPFHCVPQDPMHVILEGCLPYVMKHLLNYYVNIKKYFTIEQFNEKLEKFPYSYMDRRKKPSNLDSSHLEKDGSLRQSASQMWLLGRLLPFFVYEWVDMTSVHWRCFVTLLEIMSTVFSPCVSQSQIALLRWKIAYHLDLFRQSFPGVNIIPKQHYLLHLPSDISRLGPSMHFWCMRYEGKHSFLKQLTKIANFKNICKYMATRFQKALSLELQDGSMFNDQITYGVAKEASSDLKLRLELPNNHAEITTYSWVCINGQTFKPGCFICCGVEVELPIFWRVINILSIQGKILFDAMRYKTLGFNCGYCSFAIQKSSVIKLLSFNNLLHYEPLCCYLCGQECFLASKIDFYALI